MILLLNLVAVFFLLLSYLSPIINPSDFWFFAFIGLAYPFIAAINILFILFWILRLNKYFLISLIFMSLGYQHFINHFNLFNHSEAINKHEKSIKIFSYNVRLFDFYQWINGDKESEGKIFDLIENESPDVVCFQEFFNDDTHQPNTLKRFTQAQDAKYYHVDYFMTKRKIHHWGIATFSKYPIINRDRFQFINSQANYCIITDILYKNQDTVRVFNVHFESWHFQNTDYKFLEDIKATNTEQDNLKSGLKNIYWKMMSSYKKRGEQVDVMTALIENSPYPVIVCGDFNDTPGSYVYRQMTSDRLEDSFVEAGSGIGRTYAGSFPSFRIDYILHSKEFKARNFVKYRVKLSDHYPISTVLEFN
ncbi:MAG: endonuclease/exonuclease/phosphatase family protein [Bacteroidales bacterium]|nr:endonuclease/exonuclease/phosphatase family protein [Bacteroidales bacterium]